MKLFVVLIIALSLSTVDAQFLKRTFRLDGQATTQPQPSSNSVSQILISNGRVILATDEGINITTDGGKSFQTNFGVNSPTGASMSAIAVRGDTIVAASSSTTEISGTSYPVGDTLFVSTDNGVTWTDEPQNRDSLADSTVTFGVDTLKALPVTTDVNNITYSLVFHRDTLYSANFAGGLRRSADLGKHWERVVLPPDSLNYITEDSTDYTFQLSPVSGNITTENNLNHRVFSLYSDGDSVLYVGTAGGINKTTDNGYSWRKFNHQNSLEKISGNFVVSLAVQNSGTVHIIWGATVVADVQEDPTEKSALSYSADGGATWNYILAGHFFHAMAFHDSTVVYGASDDGLFRTQDFGQSSQVITNVFDPITKQSILSQTFYAAASNGDSIWVSSGDGTAVGVDNGNGFVLSEWRVFKAYSSVAENATYFYPNPFSPHLDVGRIHYDVKNSSSQVTIRIFDFSMHIVRTLLQNAARGAGETDERWNGTSDRGGLVDNGVYFYSVSVDGGKPAWGKIMVIR
jgi:flagellar hook assembly protein FlgD